MEEQINAGQAATLAHNTLASQINALLNLTSGSVKSQLESLSTMLDSNINMIIEASNAEINKYDALYDELINRDNELDLSRLQTIDANKRIEEIQQDIDRIQISLVESEGNAAKAEINMLSEKSRANQLEKQVNELKQLDPVGTRDRIKRKQKENEELRTSNNQLQSANIKLRTENAQSAKKIAELCNVITEADAEINRYRMQEETQVIFDKHLKRVFKVSINNEEMPGFVYMLPNGLGSVDENLIETDFKVFILSATGEGVTVMFDKYLCPCSPRTPLTDGMPQELNNALTEFAVEALEKSMPEVIERYHWLNTISVTEFLSEKQCELLLDSDIGTLKSVLFNIPRLSNLPGIGKQTAKQISKAAHDFANQFNEQRKQEAA